MQEKVPVEAAVVQELRLVDPTTCLPGVRVDQLGDGNVMHYLSADSLMRETMYRFYLLCRAQGDAVLMAYGKTLAARQGTQIW